MANDRVTVVIPTLNRHDFLCEALRSVAAQTHRNLEVVVVDDASDCAVREECIAAELGGLAYRLIRNTVRSGGARSRNVGQAAATGDYICFLDDDDVYYPSKIEVLLSALRAHPECGAAFGKIRFFDGVAYVQPVREFKSFDAEVNLLLFNCIHNNATLIRREIFDDLQYLESLSRYQDMQFNIELSLKTKLMYVNEYVAEWRVDSRSDKITAAVDRAKSVRDAAAFALLANYFALHLHLPAEVMAVYKLKLARLYLQAGQYGLALGLLLRAVLRVRYWSRVLSAWRLRRQYFLLPEGAR